MEVKFETLPNGLFAGSISGRGVYSIKDLLFLMFTSPKEIVFPREIMDTKYAHLRFALEERSLSYIASAFMTAVSDLMKYLEINWELLVDDIEKGTIHPDIKIADDIKAKLLKQIKPNPKRAAELRKEFEKGFDTPIIPRIWPELAFVHAIGSGGFTVYTDKMRHYLGNIPIYFSVYAASDHGDLQRNGISGICADTGLGLLRVHTRGSGRGRPRKNPDHGTAGNRQGL